MIIRKSNPIPVEPDGAEGIPPALGVETCSGRTTSAPAALPLGSGRNNTDAIGKHCPVATEAKHELSHDAAGDAPARAGGSRCWCGAEHGQPAPLIGGNIKLILCRDCTAKAFPPSAGRISKLVAHAPPLGEQIAPSQPHKT